MADTKKKEVPGTNITVPARLSYLHIWEPAKMADGSGELKYSASLIIKKSDTATVEAIKKAIELAKQAGAPKWGGKIPANLKLPLRDGDVDRPNDDAYKDSYFVTASSKSKPGIVGKDVKPILDESDVYSGCYGNVNINFYAFKVAGSQGVACGLNHVQKTKDGEALSGRGKAEDVFTPIEGGEGVDDLVGG
jgi:hypothetical protein